MAAAVCIAIAVMYLSANAVGGFIKRHPTTKMLGLCFLILIGVALLADGFGLHIPRGYIYFAMAFAAVVEAFNVWAKGAAATRPRVSAAGSEAEQPARKPLSPANAAGGDPTYPQARHQTPRRRGKNRRK